MLTREFAIYPAEGFHARPVKAMLTILKKYKSEVTLRSQSEVVNARSMLAILSLQLQYNARIQIAVSGPDEAELMEELVKFFEDGIMEYR